ncbi:hypothetical protein SEA_MACGULLY_6 [Rhodococcus phage MacGully]|nr:hypothetical protein SEA_MACGULLY_6 [Rhodococcus phage MacGully]
MPENHVMVVAVVDGVRVEYTQTFIKGNPLFNGASVELAAEAATAKVRSAVEGVFGRSDR